MKESYVSTLFQMRLIVGFLGERAQFAWWPTSFFGPSSHLFLEPAFPKTSNLAQYHGVVEAARRLHDDHLSVGSYHLFRLPEEVEQDMHQIAQVNTQEILVGHALRDKASALESLEHMAAEKGIVKAGPNVIGSIKEIHSLSALKAIAGAYLCAFEENVKTYPYFLR